MYNDLKKRKIQVRPNKPDEQEKTQETVAHVVDITAPLDMVYAYYNLQDDSDESARTSRVACFKLEEYVQGEKYTKIVKMSTVATEPNILTDKFRYNLNTDIEITSIQINGKEHMKDLKYVLGLYNFGIIGDERACVGARYSTFSRIKAGDTITLTIDDVLNFDNTSKRTFIATSELTFATIFSQL